MTIQNIHGKSLSQFISSPISYNGFLGGYTGGMLPVWFDIRDSEDELQEFLHKCAKYGDKYKSIKTESLSIIEGTDG